MTVKISADSAVVTAEIEKLCHHFEIHELHHHVLTSWAELRNKLPAVVTFDHHTDILPAFLRYSESNSMSEDVGKDIVKDIARLQHDEHFSYALQQKIISKAVIISHTPAVTELEKNMQVLYNGEFSEDEPLNSKSYEKYFDMALEDSFLEQFIEFMPHENYILDIDCDYFKTFKSLAPDSCKIFRRLMHEANMITVSREADWVRLLTFEKPSDFTPEYIISALGRIYNCT